MNSRENFEEYQISSSANVLLIMIKEKIIMKYCHEIILTL